MHPIKTYFAMFLLSGNALKAQCVSVSVFRLSSYFLSCVLLSFRIECIVNTYIVVYVFLVRMLNSVGANGRVTHTHTYTNGYCCCVMML